MNSETQLSARLEADLERMQVDVDPQTRAGWVRAVATVQADLAAGDRPWPGTPARAGTGATERDPAVAAAAAASPHDAAAPSGSEGAAAGDAVAGPLAVAGAGAVAGGDAPRRANAASGGDLLSGPDGAVGAVAADGPWVWRAEVPLAALGTGVLDGMRLAVKDLIAVAGRPLRAGSRVREDAPVEVVDAAVVSTLRGAGAMVVGTVKLHEFAFGVSGLNAFEGTPTNPAAPGRVPGGSSSGSAAVVAAGQADVALGTDTGGSCRIPAACCAVVGFKPSYGAIDLGGVFPLASSLDHVGWLTADVATTIAVAVATGLVAPAVVDAVAVAVAVAVVVGVAASPGTAAAGRADAENAGVLGVARQAIEGSSAEVRSCWQDVEAVLQAAGWELRDVDWPTGQDSLAASTAIMFSEAAHVHAQSLSQHADRYGADVRARLLQGRLFDLTTYLRARERQKQLRDRCRALLAGVSAVIGPTLPILPPTLTEALDPAIGAALVKHTRLANLTGFPALCLPVTVVPVSQPLLPGPIIPFSIQVEAATDERVLRVGAMLEAVLQHRR